jgi:8-oxo-dGTP pyrophosphatase MutT (NUDIX family)
MLQPEQIRQCLASHRCQSIERKDFRRAAVLVPIFWRNAEPHVIFTKRSEHVSTHKGQISFPGGRIDDGDADAWAAATRETTEEIGIPPASVELLGALDDILTITHYVVTPYVATVPADFQYAINRFELDYVFDLPLRQLADTSLMREEQVLFENRPYPIYYFQHGPHNIWGATAKILRQFLAVTDLMPGDIVSDATLPSDL